MQTYKLSDMRGGWFVGDFEPSCLRLSGCEVAIKRYRAGDKEPRHVHRLATELTVVVSGVVQFNGVAFAAGTIVQLDVGEPAEFSVIEDAVTVVVKAPSVPNDKYLV